MKLQHKIFTALFLLLLAPASQACRLVWIDVASEFVTIDDDLSVTLTVRNDGDTNCVHENGSEYSWFEFPDGSAQWRVGTPERLWQPSEITDGTETEQCGLTTITTDDDLEATHLHCGGPGWPIPLANLGDREIGLDLPPGQSLSVTAIGRFAAGEGETCLTGKIYRGSRFFSNPGILQVCLTPESAQAEITDEDELMRITRFHDRPMRLASAERNSRIALP